jgi:hypothetical protein
MRPGALNGASRATGVTLRAMMTSLSWPTSSFSTRLESFDFASCMLTVNTMLLLNVDGQVPRPGLPSIR